MSIRFDGKFHGGVRGLLPLGSFTALVYEVLHEFTTDAYIEPDAVFALATAAEDSLVKIFGSAAQIASTRADSASRFAMADAANVRPKTCGSRWHGCICVGRRREKCVSGAPLQRGCRTFFCDFLNTTQAAANTTVAVVT
jgi:hypothetical protein